MLHVQVRKGTLSPSRYLPEHFDGIPPQNRWTIRTDEPMAGTIPEVLDESQTDELDDIPICGRIRSQHVVQCHDKDIPIPITHGVRTARHLGSNEVAATPDHHAP